DESSGCFRRALEAGPTSAALCGLAQNLLTKGEEPEALELLHRAVRLAPDKAGPFIVLSDRGFYRDRFHPHIDLMKRQLMRSTLPPGDRLCFHFTLGEVFDKLGECDKAFAHFKAGNDLKRRKSNFDMQAMVDLIEAEMRVF